MKGVISLFEILTAGIILIMAFAFFFPRYSIRTKWDNVLLSMKVKDTLNTIERLDKTYEFATNSTKFNEFTSSIFTPQTGVVVWWKETKDLKGYTEDMKVPYFTEGQKETIVDVELVASEYSVDSNTVALWHFNENIGDVTYDETANNNNGDLRGGMDLTGWTDDCRFGSCLKFDGDDDYVEVTDSDSLDITDEITIEAWIKPRELPFFMYGIVDKDEAYGLDFFNEYIRGYVYVDGGEEPCLGQIPAQPDEWLHVAMTYSKNTRNIILFFNGSFDNSCPLSGLTDYSIRKSDKNLTIGTWGLLRFNGTIDEVRISNTTRTSFDSIEGYDVYSFTLGLGYPY